MKKTRITTTEILNKFIIANENGEPVTETTAKEREVALIRYPAIFNTKEDIIKYLELKKVPYKVMKHLNVCSTNLLTFSTGAILVEFDEESDADKFATVKDILSRLEKEYQSKVFCIEFLISGMNEFRMSFIVKSIFINKKDRIIQLTNEHSVGCDHYPSIEEIYDEIKDYEDYKINLQIYDHTSIKIIDEDLDKNFIIVGGSELKLITCLKSYLKRFITD